MEIWIITDNQGKYICTFRKQEDAFKMYNNDKYRYAIPLQDYAN